jgi:hypothetical protein
VAGVKDVIRSSSSLANRIERRELTGWLAFARVGAKSTLPFERQLANQIE